ncbi:MAG: methyltransferase domain-containing protein [Kiritimatiellia bacterium]|nr:methyltransferase domain-containing protein [Kiritimatiellia bacterium]
MMALFIALRRWIGVCLESFYWRRWIAAKGGKLSQLYRSQLDKSAPLSPFHRRFIDQLPQTKIRILDVGAGPLTGVGKTHPSKEIEIVATDVLAEKYARTLRKYGVVPPAPTIYADAENLTDEFAAESFDYVTANNSIDHCRNPLKALMEMLRVVKIGCYVSVRHRENEAKRTNYLGLHEWNFKLSGQTPVLWRGREEINIPEALAPFGLVTVIPEEQHVVFAVKKLYPVVTG